MITVKPPSMHDMFLMGQSDKDEVYHHNQIQQ